MGFVVWEACVAQHFHVAAKRGGAGGGVVTAGRTRSCRPAPAVREGVKVR
jgi:hypothetical protein